MNLSQRVHWDCLFFAKKQPLMVCFSISLVECGTDDRAELRILGDIDGGEAGAIIESTFSNARHALGEGDGGEDAARMESIASNTRHAIVHTIVGYRGGEGDGAGVLIVIPIVISLVGHLGRLVCLRSDVVVDAVDLEVVCTGHEGQ